jgi:hypothetical protein
MPWDREFDDPVPGMKTLRDAANYIMRSISCITAS